VGSTLWAAETYRRSVEDLEALIIGTHVPAQATKRAGNAR